MHLFLIFTLICTLSAQQIMTTPEICHFAVPYYEPVPGGLHPGMAVYVNGRVPEKSNRFGVNFAFVKHKGTDFAFYFNPRFKSNQLVINTLESGRWGREEKYQNPFQKGEHFEVIFIVTEAGYQILVNRKLLYVFRHRIPPQSVRFIQVVRDLELQSLNVTAAPVIENLIMTTPEIGHLALPYYEPVPGGLHPGMAVFVNGRVPQKSRRFGVNFAFAKHEGADLAFHFNPRFKSNQLAINTLESGRWGREERYQNPFQKGEHFEVIFIVTEAGYQILVNRKLLYVFRHRIPPQSVRFIQVVRDLELQSLNVTAAPVIENLIMTTPEIGHLALPYYEPVPGGLHPGMAVFVNGRVPQKSRRFGVNFAFAKHNGTDLAFYFNPRFKSNQLVINTLESGRWGREERYQNPFQKGEHFEVIFIVTEAGYQILVNRKLLYVFRHRIPPQSVRFIQVVRDLELQSLNVTAAPVIENLPVPYRDDIPGGLETNRTITVRGFIPKNANRFEINFTAGHDIPLHINLHMKLWRAVVCNSFLNGNWGSEECKLTFNPFQPGQYFKLSTHCDNREFKFYTNDQPFFNCTHRYVPIKNISTLEIDGDVTLSYIKY